MINLSCVILQPFDDQLYLHAYEIIKEIRNFSFGPSPWILKLQILHLSHLFITTDVVDDIAIFVPSSLFII